MSFSDIFSNIASAIRVKNGKSEKYRPDEMPNAILSISTEIPDGYLKPSGTKNITKNGTYDVRSYANTNVSVEGDSALLQNKSVTITANGNTSVSPDNGYDGLSGVSIAVAVPSEKVPEYDGSAVTIIGIISFTVDQVEYTAKEGDTWVSSGIAGVGSNTGKHLYCDTENSAVLTVSESNYVYDTGNTRQYGNTVLRDGENYTTK